MPSKRSKSRDRERKRRAKDNMTEEEVEQLKNNNRAAQKLKRDRMSNEEKVRAKLDAKTRMKIHYEKRKLNMEKTKKLSEEAAKEYEKIADKYRKQNTRSKRSEEEHIEDKNKAKKGMQEFREYGRLKNFAKRSKINKNQFSDWKTFMQKGGKYSEVLSYKKPDLIDRLNKEIREEKEREREKMEKDRERREKEEEKRKEGIWDYNGESGRMHNY